uniref:Uncharacterized protein n=1 Tax=Pipistrellus kuhlii TaxID=59472 RepID=A0A7J7YM11_PIPKU|nr:hypothetical protein mPipKuh1_010075 [Pipistrellus kuhlii]
MCGFLLHKLAARKMRSEIYHNLGMQTRTRQCYGYIVQNWKETASHTLFQAIQPLPTFAQLLPLTLLMLQLRSTSACGLEYSPTDLSADPICVIQMTSILLGQVQLKDGFLALMAQWIERRPAD